MELCQGLWVMCKDIWRFPLELGNGDIYGKGERVKAKKYVTQALKLFEKLGTLHEPEKAREVLKDLR